ncbi:Pentatricopeptide repeat [Dillenia turbinata]|uniref:Pentatricopeptide repeat n=1 Tax=Dillenia turbinata TaxID=194707 RepID=A0AAN8UZI6_9MAGN
MAVAVPTSPHSQALILNSNQNRLLLHTNERASLSQLKQIHAQTLKTTIPIDPQTHFLYSRVLHFSSAYDFNYSLRLLGHIPNPNSFMFNTLIRACAWSKDHKDQAFLLYCKMLEEGDVLPDKHTYPFVLKACAFLFDEFEGKQIHAHVLKHGFGSDVYVNNSLIHFYGSCGCLDDGKKVFDKMSERSLVSWNVMIDVLVQLGQFLDALEMFVEMMSVFVPDGYTMQSAISACAGLGTLSLGMWAHAFILRNFDVDVGVDVLVNNCLLDMYFRCGSVAFAVEVFERMDKRNLNSWNSMILGFAMHGEAEKALDYFAWMINKVGFMPNSITFVGVLSACNHRGLVDDGRMYFALMVSKYEIEPRLEHYGCLVDLLARAGLIDEAMDIVGSMPMKPDAVIWRSLLDACSKKNATPALSEEMARQVLDSEGGDCSGAYVLLSRVYASASKWDEVGLLRRLMTEKGITKEPGCSLIEINAQQEMRSGAEYTKPVLLKKN